MKKNNTSGRIIIVLISLLFGALLSGCDQEALFWDIAHEYPPIEPDIGGRPTKIVEITTGTQPVLYVSNNTENVWRYNAANNEHFWEKITKPSFTVRDLAVAQNKLFALASDGSVFPWDGSAWVPSPIHKNSGFEKLFGAGDYLFGVECTGSPGGAHGYTITCMDNAGTVIPDPIFEDTGLLMGAVYDGTRYYLGTLGDGLYSGAPGSFVPETVIAAGAERIVGLTAYKGNVFAVGPSTIYFPTRAINTRYPLSGAVTGWTDGTDHLLLVGVQHSSDAFGYGYREIQISDTTGVPNGRLIVPGEGITSQLNPAKTLSSVKYGSQYVSAIGEHAVNNFYVMPHDFTPYADDGDSNHNAPPRPVIFAATVKDGLWSYRPRNGSAQWNGEDGTPF